MRGYRTIPATRALETAVSGGADGRAGTLARNPRNIRWIREYILVGAFFLSVACGVLWEVIFAKGLIAGGDWSTPVTRLQLEGYSKNGRFLWTHFANVFGVAQPYLTTFTDGLFFAASRVLNGPQIDRAFLIFLYTFAGSSVFAYARFLRVHPASALAAGTLYVTAPIFFNYTAMGWGFILLAFSFIPWMLILFTWSVKGGALLPALSVALIFAIGFSLASQCIVWYPVALAAYATFVVRSRVELWRATRALILCGLVLLVLNLQWILPLLRYGDPLLSSAAAESEVPLGQRLNVLNILRGWGSLFNWPYETSYPDSLLIFSLLSPMAAYAALFLRPRDWRVRFLVTLTLIPLIFYVLPDVFYNLPFTAVIRDVSRFLLFQALASSLLVALTFDWFLAKRASLAPQWRVHTRKALGVGLAIALLVAAYPVWAGELTGEPKENHDIRLRALSLPRDYDSVERELTRANGSAKALYLPAGLLLNVPADARFSGQFREFIDSYAAYAPRPGGIFAGDRRAGEYRTVASFVNGHEFLSAGSPPSETLAAMGVRWLVVRRDLQGQSYSTSALLRHLDTDGSLVKRYDSDIVLYENPLALPIVYGTTAPVFHDTTTSSGIANAFPDGFAERRQVIFFRGSGYKTTDERLVEKVGNVGTQRPSITFQRVNPTRFDIRIDNATGPFFLVLSETFDPRWHLSPAPGSLNLPPAKDGAVIEAPVRNDFVWSDASLSPRPSLFRRAHVVANGYANAWYIDPEPGRTTLTFRAEFAPQSLAYVGAGIASTAVVVLVAAIAVLAIRQTIRRKRVPFTASSYFE